MKTIQFRRRFADGSFAILGHAVLQPPGWRFIPLVAGRKPSRRAYDTWEECLPRWVGYPDRCESDVQDAAEELAGIKSVAHLI